MLLTHDPDILATDITVQPSIDPVMLCRWRMGMKNGEIQDRNFTSNLLPIYLGALNLQVIDPENTDTIKADRKAPPEIRSLPMR